MSNENSENIAVTERAVETAEVVQEPVVEESGVGQMVPADVRRNMKVNILFDSLANSGFADLGIALVPMLVFLGATNTTIGIVNGSAVTATLGLLVSPFITRRFRIKKWYYAGTSLLFMTALCLLGLVVLFNDPLHLPNARLLTYVVVLMFGAYVAYGFTLVPGQEFMAACIPSHLRGRLVGYSISIGGGLAIGGALIAKWILKNVEKPEAFGYVILIGWAIYMIGLVAVLFAREMPTPVEKSPKAWSKGMFKATIQDKPFLRVITLMNLYSILVAPAGGFVLVYGYKELGLPAATAATFAIIDCVVRLTVSPLAGHVVDRFKPEKLIPYTFLLAGVAFLLPVFMHNVYGIYIYIFLATCYGVMLVPASTSLIYGLPSAENRSGHFTIQLLLKQVAAAIGPVAAGLLLDTFVYRQIFLVVAIIAIAFFPFSKLMLRGVVRRA